MHRFEILVNRPWEDIFFDEWYQHGDPNSGSIYKHYNMVVTNTLVCNKGIRMIGIRYSVEVESPEDETIFRLKYGV